MKILLHSCCAVCSAAVIEKLQQSAHQVVVFFYNPNIFPHEEYEMRKKDVENYCAAKNVKFIEGEYDHERWLEDVRGHDNDLEGGARCGICFFKRLAESAQVASEQNCDALATTLTISPHKNVDVINQIGHEMAGMYGVKFIDTIWRKEQGFKRALELAKENDFYQQSYCGCEFSQ